MFLPVGLLAVPEHHPGRIYAISLKPPGISEEITAVLQPGFESIRKIPPFSAVF